MAAKDSALGALHEKLANAYSKALDGDEVSPALLTSVAKFLKDNGIEAEADNAHLTDLKDKVSNVTQFPFDPREAQTA